MQLIALICCQGTPTILVWEVAIGRGARNSAVRRRLASVLPPDRGGPIPFWQELQWRSASMQGACNANLIWCVPIGGRIPGPAASAPEAASIWNVIAVRQDWGGTAGPQLLVKVRVVQHHGDSVDELFVALGCSSCRRPCTQQMLSVRLDIRGLTPAGVNPHSC